MVLKYFKNLCVLFAKEISASKYAEQKQAKQNRRRGRENKNETEEMER